MPRRSWMPLCAKISPAYVWISLQTRAGQESSGDATPASGGRLSGSVKQPTALGTRGVARRVAPAPGSRVV